MTNGPRLCQIAFSVTDLERTHAFYRDVLGFLPAGGTESFRGPLASQVQGLPEPTASVCWWMVDQQELMQLEMFEFESPPVRPLPADWRPCDIGYTMLGLHVRDLDAALERLDRAGTSPLAPVLGAPGSRRVCVRDPEGVLLELMEDDPRSPEPRPRIHPEASVAVRSVTVSVPDRAKARRVWRDALGLPEAAGVSLHAPEHEALWGLEGAARDDLLLWADDVLVELVEYEKPRGRPWPEEYRISDQGILNIALSLSGKEELRQAYDRVLEAGCLPNCDLLDTGDGGVVYVNDEQGFSIELMSSSPERRELIGFVPRPTGTLSDLSDLTGHSRRG